jgi:hypothetical protein
LVWLIRTSGTAELRPPSGHLGDAEPCRAGGVLSRPRPLAPGSPAAAGATYQTRNGGLRLGPPGRRPSPPAGSVTRGYLRAALSPSAPHPHSARGGLIGAKRSFTPPMRHLLTRAARRGDTQRVALVRDALRLLGVGVTYPVSRRPVRPLAGEAMRSLPGDELVADTKVRWNHAVTIRAHPAGIWPWLVQMGCRRAGWYSYDGLDNGGVPSAARIVPELQRVQAGDIFPMTPQAQDRFVVRVAGPDRALVLGDDAGQMSWAFVLEPAGERSTRLITRSRGTTDRVALGLMLKVFWHRSTSGWNDGNCSTSSDSWRQHDGAPRHRGPRGC